MATREFVLKIEELCNLACDYCYMYELADQGWVNRPGRMSPETLKQVAVRLGEHARIYEMTSVRVILHGGEPLMFGPAGIASVVATLREHVPCEISVQTNGTLLTRAMLDTLSMLRVRVGVSVDGSRDDHDRHRTYADGRPSFDKVAAGIELLREYPDVYGGLLCVVDLDNDPIETYKTLMSFGPARIDFLLPLFNHENRPPGKGPADYADWLYAVFDLWYSAKVRPVGIRFFEEIMHMVLGGQSRTSFLGPTVVPYPLVVESDGTIEMVDSLKSTYEGAAATGLDVFASSFTGAAAVQDGFHREFGQLASPCRRCPLRPVCGGGQLAHRWNGVDFDSESVYCASMKRLIRLIRGRVFGDLYR
jgi:uncharacterized protein